MERHTNSQTLRIFAAILSYPTEELQEALPEFRRMLKSESWLSKSSTERLSKFIDDLAEADIYDAQEVYVSLFDRTPSLSLHLFEHIHGDSRDRGQALVDLDLIYRELGLENASEHTPDYLPMFLEYLSLLPLDQVRSSMDGVIEIIATLQQRLVKRESDYAVVLEALQSLATRQPDSGKLKAALTADAGSPLSNDLLDAAWEEQFALAAPRADDTCPKAQQMLVRMQEDTFTTGGKL
jgi:nitrate reductase molybdenum cofactor assembly chaperone NarJ/NarW